MPLQPFADAVAGLVGAIGSAAETLVEDTAEFASEAAVAFGETMDSTEAEWEEFIEGLTNVQADVMGRLVVFMRRAATLATELAQTRSALIAGSFPDRTSLQLQVRGALELIEAGVKLLGDMRDAFGTSAIDQAIWDASPFLARKMHLPEI